MKKILFLIVAIVAACFSGFANDNAVKLAFAINDDSVYIVTADGVSITPSEDSLLISSNGVDKSFPYGNISKLYFIDSATDVVAFPFIEEEDVADTQVDIFTLEGTKTRHFQSAKEALRGLAPGTYIFKPTNSANAEDSKKIHVK